MKDKVSPSVLNWLKKAESDLGFARSSFEEFDDFYSQMCILCHDAVEKCLKAYLISRNRRYKKIHDLLTLLNDCIESSKDIEEFISYEDNCRVLNNYYTPLKYPSHYPLATREQAKEAIRIAEEMYEFIKSQIS